MRIRCEFEHEEFAAAQNCLSEVLSLVPAGEFEARMGMGREEVRNLLDRLNSGGTVWEPGAGDRSVIVNSIGLALRELGSVEFPRRIGMGVDAATRLAEEIQGIYRSEPEDTGEVPKPETKRTYFDNLR